MVEKTISKLPQDEDDYKSESQLKIFWRRLRKNPMSMICLGILVILILLAVLAPWITPYDYAQMDIANKFSGPSATHWFGTDELGRDIFTRVIYGGRYSLSIALISIVVALIIGVIIGSIAGFIGGTADNLLMRFLDIFQAVPDMIMTIAISAALGSGFDKTILAISIARVPQFSRLLRASIMGVRNMEYVEAAEAIGCSKVRRITKYILPNAWTPLIVSATMGVAGTILSLASLSYIGLGIPAPRPEWGALLSGAKSYIRDYPYMLVFPGLAIALTVFSLNTLGDGIRDALDPKLKD